MNHLRHIRRVLLALAVSAIASAFASEPSSPDDSGIEYSTVEKALSALGEKRSVTFQKQSGWLVAEDSEAGVVWLFPPPGHVVFPSMFKRPKQKDPNGAVTGWAIRCLASKLACDRYFGDNWRLGRLGSNTSLERTRER